MIIKKGIFILFAFLFGFLALNSAPVEASDNYFSNTIEAEGSDCGVAGGDMVASVSFSICKEDLAYNVVYMAFSKVFNQFDVLKAFVFEDAGALDQEGYASNMGGAILAIILGITQVVFIVGAVILGLATVKVIYASMASGEFLGKGVNKVWVILRSLLVIFMIFPLGTVSLAQLCVLMVALFAIMGGNFFYGIFLSTVQKEAMIAENSPSEETQNEAISQSDALINAALCQNRTLKAIRDKNFTKYEDKWIGSLAFDTQMKRIANCIAPEAYYSYPLTTYSANPIKQGNVDSITIGKKTTCEGVADTTFLSEYDPEYHGHAFSCGSLSFANPRISEEVSTGNGESDADEMFMSTTRDAISTYVAAQYKNYGLAGKLESYYGKASTIKSGNEFSYKTLDSDVTSFAATLTTGGKALYNEVKAETDHNTAVKSLYVANSILLNNLLGGKSDASESVVGLLNVVTTPALIVTGVSELGKVLNDRYALKKEDSFADLQKYSVNAASALDQVHCLKNFKNVVTGIYATQKGLVDNKEDSFKGYLDQAGSVYSGECVWFVSKAEEINPRYNVTGFASPTFTAGGQTVKITMGPAGGLVAAKVDEAAVAGKMNTDVIAMTLEAQVNKMALASHFYVVRSAIKKSMIDVLAESTDKELPKKMRKQGFASFGGFILQISSDQTNLNKYIKKINSGVKWSAFSEGGEGQYIEMEAFGKVDLSVAKQDIKFIPMVVVDFFAGGSSTTQVAAGAATGGNSGSTGDDSFMNSVYRTIEDGLTGPMVYLKKMGGTDLNLPLRAGVEKCFKEGNCYPGDVHPVNALSYMGIDLMDTAIKFFMLKVVINLINKVMNADLDSNGSTSKYSWISKIANMLASGLLVGKIVKYSVMIAEGIVNFLAPIFALLFLAGVFFGYMLPILPYVAFLIMFLGWIVYIFELMITVPIWLIMMAIPGPNGQPRGNLTLLWQYTGLLLLKPSLMVIGLIFGWYFSVLSIFFINMTFFGVMGAVFESHTGFSVMGIIDIIMFYFVYLVIVFVALKHSFSIISSFPQTVAEAIELRGYSDKQTISSVGAEQLLGLAIVGKVKGAVTEAVGGVGKKVDHFLGNSPEQRNERAARSEARKTANGRLDEHFRATGPQNQNQANGENGGSGFGGAGGGANPSNSDTRTADSGSKGKKGGNDDPVV